MQTKACKNKYFLFFERKSGFVVSRLFWGKEGVLSGEGMRREIKCSFTKSTFTSFLIKK